MSDSKRTAPTGVGIAGNVADKGWTTYADLVREHPEVVTGQDNPGDSSKIPDWEATD